MGLCQSFNSKEGNQQWPVPNTFSILSPTPSLALPTFQQIITAMLDSTISLILSFSLCIGQAKINNFIINFQKKQTMELLKSKRSLSSSKKVTKSSSKNKTSLLKVYGADFKNKKDNKKQKLKLNNKNNKRKDTQEYQFPEFSIAFNDCSKNSAFKSCIDNQLCNSKLSLSNKSQIANKLEKPSTTSQDTINTNKKYSKKQQSQSLSTNRTIDNNGKGEVNSSLGKQYLKCIAKIFKTLDIFNKGKISEGNINKWLPEPALYFLGKVFQKIRSERLCLNQSEFQSLCCSLLNESHAQDVKWFIDQINKSSSLKKSVNLPEKQLFQLSPIEKRMIEQEYIKNSAKQKLNYKHLPYQELITLIKAKQADRSQQLPENKRKSVTIGILQQKTYKFQQNTQKYGLTKASEERSFINTSNFEEDEQNSIPIKKCNLKKSLKLQQPYLQKSPNQNVFHRVEMQNRIVPNFTFQLPKPFEANCQSKFQKNETKEKFQAIFSKEKGISGYSKKLQINRPYSDRYQRNHQPSMQPQKVIDTYRQSADEDNKRLDHLRSKVQGFLKQNAQKINKNKSFFFENCSSQL